MTSGLSLAHKCQILFGLAIVLLLMAALSVPWFRAASQAGQAQEETSQLVAGIWLEWALREVRIGHDEAGQAENVFDALAARLNASKHTGDSATPTFSLFSVADMESQAVKDPFLQTARRQFEEQPDRLYHSATRTGPDGEHTFRYVQAIRRSSLIPDAADRGDDDPLIGLLVVEHGAARAAGLLLVDRMYIIAAGVAAGTLASLLFYYITTRLVLSPVRVLREVAERVQTGDMNIRSDIQTRDEFEQLSDTFNGMLIALKDQQDSLRTANESLDLRLTELAQTNIDLYESARLKGEFLASISHELRTPLNSIIGFAEILQEIAEHEIPRDEQTAEQTKRFRYISNIVTSGRTLLDMINDLLEMAKIEAGKVDIRIEPTSVGDLCEVLAGLIRPQAKKRRIDLELRLDPDLPLVETDPGRLRQIVFNFLSNAVKFTPESGQVELWAERIQLPTTHPPAVRTHVRIGVTDTGPGIPDDMQRMIFERFRQVDASATREHSGTGLGLAICKELAGLLHGEIEVISRIDHGSTFSITLPAERFTPDDAAIADVLNELPVVELPRSPGDGVA